ncbi:MAG: cyclic nucleotide-binding domain-containing protein [Anaerolineae bacterium]|nr:cyclic nucleotide-binding domain-containing protein [Anaerolineae bacterium]
MSEQKAAVDLFALGQQHFTHFLAEFAAYGIEADPGIELRQGAGVLCYYSLEDRHIYLSVPDFNQPLGKFQALFLRSLLGCDSDEALFRFLGLFIPHIIAHELAHHYRHRYGMFSDKPWQEEQIANKLSVAVVKHRLTPEEKVFAKEFLRRAIETLATKMEEKSIAVDSYYSVLHALNVSGQVGTADFENIELLQKAFGVQSEAFLKGSGHLSREEQQRLEQRQDVIESINQEYTSDQIKYIYYHVGWLYLDLTSRETEYVDEFARDYLNFQFELLPPIAPQTNTPDDNAIQACFLAYLRSQPISATAGRYFYKRYRSLLLARLQSVELTMTAHSDRLKREARLILENWSGEETDTLDYISQLAPPALRPLFPHRIAEALDPHLSPSKHLPTETDRRLWAHVVDQVDDEGAANTLHRLSLLDRTDIYRGLPIHVLLKLIAHFSLVRFAPGEPVIWQNERNDDVYILIEGKLEVLVDHQGQPTPVGTINANEIFGEIAFFTEDPRYATVRAVEPSKCYVLTDVDLQLLAYEHPTILMQMAGVLAKRLAAVYNTSRNETV